VSHESSRLIASRIGKISLKKSHYLLPTMAYLLKFHWRLSSFAHPTDNIGMMTSKPLESVKRKVAAWMRQGISPERLALTLALGIAIGCIPMVGVTTALCMIAALTLRLNFPVIQAANWASMPMQVALLVPFVRLGGRLFGFGPVRDIHVGTLLHTPPLALISQLGGLAGHALIAWLLIAIPAVALMTAMLTAVLRRVPAVAAAQAGD
jgi:uncharacterized protein (DUF2062 family)